MRLAQSLLVLCLAYSSTGFAEKKPTNRIVGGVPATAGEFPYIVSLQKGTSHFCGGSLIAKGWVLTAAHCVRSGMSRVKVVIGLLKQGDTAGVESFTVEKTIVHPDNDSSNNDHDFALLKLKGTSKFTPVIINSTPLDAPDEEEDAPKMTTAGWGTTSSSGSLSAKLLKVEVPLVSTERCEAAYPGDITESMFCAGFDKGGKDSCQGDSGGPIVMKSVRSGRTVLAGVVSWGEGCAKPKKYGVYGNILSAIEWIREETAAKL